MKNNYNSNKINEIIEPAELVSRLLNEFKGNKHTPTVKGRLWQLIGMLLYYFNKETERYKKEVNL